MMRQQLLHGYVLHQRAYREKSRLVHFFSLESGRIDGVARQHLPPLYQPALLYASGKTSLKTFAKIEQAGSVYTLTGQALFAGFYLNELLVRLLPLEESCPELFATYGWALESLMAFGRQTDAVQAKRELLLILRRFEQVLLDTLGYTPRFDQDADGQLIVSDAHYRYRAGVGFERSATGDTGRVLQSYPPEMSEWSAEHLGLLTRVHRVIIQQLCGDQPLRSRELWQSQNRFVQTSAGEAS